MSEELATQVFLVRTPEEQDAVIVSFVDDGEVNGIYLYEPGADPIEVDAVQIEGTATEFEFATITVGQRVDSAGVRLSYGPANRHWKDVTYPGDGMVTRAQRDADVEQATENLANLQQAFDTLREQAQAMVEMQRTHHTAAHSGTFQLCPADVCTAARAVEL